MEQFRAREIAPQLVPALRPTAKLEILPASARARPVKQLVVDFHSPILPESPPKTSVTPQMPPVFPPPRRPAPPPPHRRTNVPDDALHIPPNLAMVKAQNLHPQPTQPNRPFRLRSIRPFPLGDTAIHLHRQSGRRAVKIGDSPSKHPLTLESRAHSAQSQPQPRLRPAAPPTHLPRPPHQLPDIPQLARHPCHIPHSTPPSPPPQAKNEPSFPSRTPPTPKNPLALAPPLR